MNAVNIAPNGSAFRPQVPIPREKPAGLLHYLYLLWRNPIETWTHRHYEDLVLVDKSALGRITVVSDPAGIRRIFLDNAANYEKDGLQIRILKTGKGEGLLVAKGDLWRRTRRTLAPLFTPKRIAAFAPRMRAIAEARVERWLKRRDGAVLEIDREMIGVTFDILSATLFSGALADDAQGFEQAMGRYIESIGKIDPLDVLNVPSWVPRLGRLTARSAIAFFEEKVASLVGTRQRMIAAGKAAPDDLLTALIEARDPETGAGLSEEEVAANIITFIGAGHETTARALAWTLHLVARSPATRDAIEAELATADSRSLDTESLPYTRAVFEEAMRLFPPVPLMSRYAIEADTIAGVEIPEKTLVAISPWLVHRHRKLWDDPEVFRPERFLPGAREKIDRFAYLPFGAGPRICIGARFAMEEAIIILATILKRVRLHPTEPTEPRPLHRITLRPATRLPMHVHARA